MITNHTIIYRVINNKVKGNIAFQLRFIKLIDHQMVHRSTVSML
jgi:hypothetical protein